MNLDVSKACQDTDIPSKIVNENADIFASFLHTSFNTSVTNSEFPSVLKQTNITCMFRQINEYMDVFLSKHQCGFRKGYSTQQCLLAMLKKWKSALNNKKTFGA